MPFDLPQGSTQKEITEILPTSSPKGRSDGIWTPFQRQAFILLCLILLGVVSVQDWRQHQWLADPPQAPGPRSDEIQDRLDPNIASAAALAVIPNLGEKRAAEIVDYRERFSRTHPGVNAFNAIIDLEVLKGFGPATTANLSNYLEISKLQQTQQQNRFGLAR